MNLDSEKSENLFSTKSELRKYIKQLRKDCFTQNPEYRRNESKRICDAVIKSEFFAESAVILAFMPLFDEVDILSLLEAATAQNKLIAVPRIVPGTCLMDFYYVDYSKINGGMETGSYGIFEPDENSPEFGVENLRDKLGRNLNNKEWINLLVLVPGLGFTEDGKRIGRGKGFYDRYLEFLEEQCKNYNVNIKKTGICFPFQIMKTIPVDKNDCLVDQVIF